MRKTRGIFAAVTILFNAAAPAITVSADQIDRKIFEAQPKITITSGHYTREQKIGPASAVIHVDAKGGKCEERFELSKQGDAKPIITASTSLNDGILSWNRSDAGDPITKSFRYDSNSGKIELDGKPFTPGPGQTAGLQIMQDLAVVLATRCQRVGNGKIPANDDIYTRQLLQDLSGAAERRDGKPTPAKPTSHQARPA